MITKLNSGSSIFRLEVAIREMDRRTLLQLEEHFKAFIAPLLDENDPEDVSFSWEFQKFFHTKKMRVLTAERENARKWKQVLLSR